MPEIRSLEIPEVLSGQRLDRIVALETGLSRAAVADLVQQGAVIVDGLAEYHRSRRLEVGERVEVRLTDRLLAPELQGDPTVEFEVLHEDDSLVVIDKPADAVVHPGAGRAEGTLVHGLLDRYPEMAGVGEADRPGIVHRLDRGTSGVLIAARTPRAHAALSAALAAREVTRVYWAMVREIPAAGRGTVDAPIGRSARRRTKMAIVADGRPSVTHYEVVDTFSQPVEVAELRCRIETGRTHQIRVHLSSIGHPVIGDERYGRPHGPFADLGRLALHASSVSFEHPETGERLEVRAELPTELVALKARCSAVARAARRDEGAT